MTSADRPVRVAMVVRLFAPWIGGTERQAAALSSALVDAGHVPTLVTGRWFRGTEKREVNNGYHVVRLPTLYEFFGIRGLRKFGGYLFIVALIAHLLRHRKNYDVVHVHGLNYHTYAAVTACRLTGTPCIVKLANSGANSDIKKMQEDRQLWLASRMLPTALKCDRFVALNSLVVEELVDAGADADRIVRLANGVQLVEESENAVSADTKTQSIRIIYVGRLHPQKSLPDLVDAFAAVAAEHAEVECYFIGEGPDVEALTERIDSLMLADRLHLPGRSESIPTELEKADIFVLPSAVEGMSNALLEAMAAGLAVIVSDIAGNRDVVTHGVDGLLFPHGDVTSLEEAMMLLVADESQRRQLGRAAQETIRGHYTMDAVVQGYVELYRTLMLDASSTSSSTGGTHG